MDESYGAEPSVKPPMESESVDEENAENAEILIAKGDLKEGDTVTFRVSKDFGDEVSLERVTASAEPTNDNMTATTESEIAALDQEEV